jgi:hypothetical protein
MSGVGIALAPIKEAFTKLYIATKSRKSTILGKVILASIHGISKSHPG